jgi:hypothetical protein
MRRAFARWRVRVWDKRLKRTRAIWHSAEQRTGSSSLEAMFWEGQVTKALAKRVKWRKRAGIRKVSEAAGKPEPRLPDPGQPERWRS